MIEIILLPVVLLGFFAVMHGVLSIATYRPVYKIVYYHTATHEPLWSHEEHGIRVIVGCIAIGDEELRRKTAVLDQGLYCAVEAPPQPWPSRLWAMALCAMGKR